MIATGLLIIFAYSALVSLVCLASAISEALEDKPAQHIAKRDDAFLLNVLRDRVRYPRSGCERGVQHIGGNTL